VERVIAESTTADALLSYICQHPSDNVARLGYADVLEERGEDERAEFIRIQLELPGPLAHCQCNLHRRERELLEAHRVQWCASLVPGVTVDAWSLDEPMQPYVYGMPLLLRPRPHSGDPLMEVWCMNRNRTIRQLSDEEVQTLPDWAVSTLDNGFLVTVGDSVLGLSREHLEDKRELALVLLQSHS
jgi:uncharacterized protein (TIGR02996 family)